MLSVWVRFESDKPTQIIIDSDLIIDECELSWVFEINADLFDRCAIVDGS